MADAIHPAATHHLPGFITAPGEADLLLNGLAIAVVLGALGLGILFLRLHSLPEHIAHKGQKLQLDVVAVLCLLALFTHNHAFWVAALLLAFIDLPDFGSPLRRIAGSLEQIATGGPGRRGSNIEPTQQPSDDTTPADTSVAQHRG